jgi:hypothetical protein
MPAATERRPARGLSAVDRGPPAEWDRPDVRIQAPGSDAIVQFPAAREPRSAIRTPSTACRSADGDRWMVSPRPRAASMSASSTLLNSSISRSSAAMRTE